MLMISYRDEIMNKYQIDIFDVYKQFTNILSPLSNNNLIDNDNDNISVMSSVSSSSSLNFDSESSESSLFDFDDDI